MNRLSAIIVAGGNGTRMTAESGEEQQQQGAAGSGEQQLRVANSSNSRECRGAAESGEEQQQQGAAGSGEWQALVATANIKKQFLPLCGTPILMHTISVFYSLYPDCEIIVAIAKNEQEHWKGLCRQYKFNVPHKITDGGNTRFQSVQNALQIVGNADFIAVHDGVRPLVSERVILEAVSAAEKHGAAVPVVMPVDSLRQIIPTEVNDIEHSKPVEREQFRTVQTPQVFKADWLYKAYKQEYQTHFTDDASVVESAGYNVVLTQGDRNNIKITTKTDLYLAELICKNH